MASCRGVIDRDQDKRQAIAYLDGKEVDRSRFDAGIAIDNNGSLIVGNNFCRNSPWVGAIDELAIYDKALPGERVATHFVAGKKELSHRLASPSALENREEFFELKYTAAADRTMCRLPLR